MALLEGRLIVAERQLERLLARREESDRLIDSELAMMRARLEETLTAFAGASQEHKEAMAASERRLLALASEAERHTKARLDSLRAELVGRMDESSRDALSLEARVRGHKQAFEEEASKRAAALEGTVSEGRERLENMVASAVADLDARIEATMALLKDARAAELEPLRAEVASRMDEWMAEPLEQVKRVHADLNAAQDAMRAAAANFRREALDAVAGSEEKALGAALHLESIVVQLRRRLVDDEAEWSALVREAGDTVSSIGTRVEDILGRVCVLEATDATERGSLAAQLEAIGRRLELHETSSREAGAETSSQSQRIEAMSNEIWELARLRTLVQEQIGAIDYLKQRIHEPSARVPAPPIAEGEPAPESATEPAGPELGAEPAVFHAPVPVVGMPAASGPSEAEAEDLEHLLPRLRAVEGALAALYGFDVRNADAAVGTGPAAGALEARLEDLFDRQGLLAKRLEELEGREPPPPSHRRRRH
jgi:hypothetical protein